MKTKIIEARGTDVFCKRLDEALKGGWQLQGNLVVTHTEFGVVGYYIQLLTKPTKPKTK